MTLTPPNPSPGSEFDKKYAALQIKRSESHWRRIIKRQYIKNLLNQLTGPTLDIGCGAGQLLEALPRGSFGTEVNPFLLGYLRKRCLDVVDTSNSCDRLITHEIRDMAIKRRVRSACLNHTLEHFSNPELLLKDLAEDCKDIGIDKIAIVVPCLRGYESDKTHKTYINIDWINKKRLLAIGCYKLDHHHYFPVNAHWPGNHFKYSELILTYQRLIGKNPGFATTTSMPDD